MKLRLKQLRTEKGLTQAQMAEAAGLSQSYYSQLESGQKQMNQMRLEGAARALGVDVFDLFEQTDEELRLFSQMRAMPNEDRDAIFRLAARLYAARHKDETEPAA